MIMKNESQAAQILRNEILNRRLASEGQLDGPITQKLIESVDSKVIQYWELNRFEELNKVLEQPTRQAEGRKRIEVQKAQRLWTKGTIKDAEEISAIAADWAKEWPQFEQIPDNCAALVAEVKKRRQLVTPETLTDAFVDLASRGLLYLTPEAIGLDGGDSIRGRMLTDRPDFWKFLQPYKPMTDVEREQKRIDAMSADQFKEYAGLKNTDIPPLVEASIRKSVALFKAQHPEYAGDEEAQQVLLGFIYQNNLPVTFNSLELAYAACQKELRAVEAIDDSLRPLKYGISTLVENRLGEKYDSTN
jgi:hypothetical protein